MGNYISKNLLHNKIAPDSDNSIIKEKPTYYTNVTTSHNDYYYANYSWKLIVNNDETIRSNIYNKKKYKYFLC